MRRIENCLSFVQTSQSKPVISTRSALLRSIWESPERNLSARIRMRTSSLPNGLTSIRSRLRIFPARNPLRIPPVFIMPISHPKSVRHISAIHAASGLCRPDGRSFFKVPITESYCAAIFFSNDATSFSATLSDVTLSAVNCSNFPEYEIILSPVISTTRSSSPTYCERDPACTIIVRRVFPGLCIGVCE